MLIDEGFAWLILEIVREIPCRKVATYGQIAKLAGHPRHSRAVGHVLAHAEHFGDYAGIAQQYLYYYYAIIKENTAESGAK